MRGRLVHGESPVRGTKRGSELYGCVFGRSLGGSGLPGVDARTT